MKAATVAFMALIAISASSAKAEDAAGWVIRCYPDGKAKANAKRVKPMICVCEPVTMGEREGKQATSPP